MTPEARKTRRWTRAGLPALVAALLLAVGVRPAAAQDNGVLVLTLDDALRIASEQNRGILQAQEFRRQVTGRYVEERAAALPQVTVTAGASRNHDESQNAFGGGFIPVRNDTRSVEAGLSQPLFTWGQVGAAIRAARIGFGTAEDRLRVSRQAAALDVTASFHDVLLARELHGIARQNLEQKARHLDEATRKRDAGTATDYDVLAARVGVDNARPEVIRAENRIRISRDRLRFLLGVEGREIDVAGTLSAPGVPVPGYGEALRTARENRPELSELRRRMGISAELVRVARAGDKPRIDLRAGYGWRELDFGEADADGEAWTVGVFATWPLFDGLRTRGRVAQAESDLRALRIGEADLLGAIEIEVRSAVDAVREADEIVEALSGTVAQAGRLLELAEKGFEFGVKTRLDVEDAELAAVQAKGNLARARRDSLVARAALSHAMGVLDGRMAPPAERPWTPAVSPAGLVGEVLRNEPSLSP